MCRDACMHRYALICVGTPGVIPLTLSALVFEAGSLTGLKLASQAREVGQ